MALTARKAHRQTESKFVCELTIKESSNDAIQISVRLLQKVLTLRFKDKKSNVQALAVNAIVYLGIYWCVVFWGESKLGFMIRVIRIFLAPKETMI